MRAAAGRPGRRALSVKNTSRRAHHEHVLDGKATTELARILACIRDSAVELNRRQISELTGIPINAVTGRVNSVLEDKDLRDGLMKADRETGKRKPALIRVAYELVDPVTHRSVEYLELLPHVKPPRAVHFDLAAKQLPMELPCR